MASTRIDRVPTYTGKKTTVLKNMRSLIVTCHLFLFVAHGFLLSEMNLNGLLIENNVNSKAYVCESKDICPKLFCRASGIEVIISIEELRKSKLDPESLHLLNRSCKNFPITADNVNVQWPIGVGVCGTILTVNATHAVYKNIIYMAPDPTNIIYREEIAINVSCTYPLDMITSLGTVLWPIIRYTWITIDGFGKFKVAMALYKDLSYVTPFEGPELNISTADTLYVGVFIAEGDTTAFNLVMENCFATPTNNIYDSVKYFIIQNSCPKLNDVTIKVYENGLSSKGQFSVQMFKFIGDYSRVYLHCEVHLCYKLGGPSCLPVCPGEHSRRGLDVSRMSKRFFKKLYPGFRPGGILSIGVLNLSPLFNVPTANSEPRWKYIYYHADYVTVQWPIGVGVCGTTLTVNDTHAVYRNTIYMSPDPVYVIYREEIAINVYCAYPLDMITSLGTVLWPIVRYTWITIDGYGEFMVAMALYKDLSYLTPYQETELIFSTADTLYVGVAIAEGDTTSFNLVMENCFATPTNNINDPLKYYIIENRCLEAKVRPWTGRATLTALETTNISVAGNCSECHPDAICEERSDVRQCSCKDGFVGDGFFCSDIDECAYSWSNNCSSTDICLNTFGSYTCDCRNGYIKSFRNICIDVDECANSSLNHCDVFATCSNHVGGYSCTCRLGYYGDGFACEFDECTTNVCGEGKECIKHHESYKCSDLCFNYTVLDEPWRSASSSVGSKCDIDKFGWHRFTGSGGIRMPEFCVPQERCGTSAPLWLNGTHPLPSEGIVNYTACAHWNGDCCFWSSFVQIKACPGGYHVYNLKGTPYCSLAYCTDSSSTIDTCKCADDEECVLTNGTYSCYCRNRHEILEKLSCVQNFKLVKRRRFSGSEEEMIHREDIWFRGLRHVNCGGFKDGNNTGLISVLSPLGDGKCGTQLHNNGTHAIYSNTLYMLLETDQIIIRTHDVQINFSCAYPLNIKLSLEPSLRPILSSANIYIGGTGQFKAEMALYHDHNYLLPYTGTEVTLSTSSTLYVEVRLQGAGTSQYALVMKNCYATPTRNDDDPVKYHIIKERCPNRQDTTIKVQENGVSTRGRFSVQMFKFVGNYDLVYLHCEINICDTRRRSCKPSCSGVRSRMAVNDDGNVVLDLGPIRRSGAYSSWPLVTSLILCWLPVSVPPWFASLYIPVAVSPGYMCPCTPVLFVPNLSSRIFVPM
ncbi:uromodulin [Pelobates cultripes]|uniref:Uromodulin n=1 Tax=Pelobates cultripes TaxID=61616 RepID=A0AAD1SPD5_PELCU|nr:uromodulin [Pelobates cultripes]